MKKYFIILALLLTFQTGSAQNIQTLFNEFKDEAKAEFTNVTPLIMSFAKLFMNDLDEEEQIVRQVKSVKVLELENCSEKVKERFNKRMHKLKLKNYETLLRSNDGDSRTQVLVKIDKDIIREVLVIESGCEDCTLIQMKGKIHKKDIETLINGDKAKKKYERG